MWPIIARWNNLKGNQVNFLQIGQEIILYNVDTKPRIYKVKKDQTIKDIAKKFNVDENNLIKWNGTSYITAGEKIIVYWKKKVLLKSYLKKIFPTIIKILVFIFKLVLVIGLLFGLNQLFIIIDENDDIHKVIKGVIYSTILTIYAFFVVIVFNLDMQIDNIGFSALVSHLITWLYRSLRQS